MSDIANNDDDAGKPGLGRLGKLPQPVLNDAIVPVDGEDDGTTDEAPERGGNKPADERRSPAGDVNSDREFDYGEQPVEPGP